MQELRIFREAWRLSRYTFFDLTNADHETLRVQVDDIYYSSLALLLKLIVEFDDDDTVIAQMLVALGIHATRNAPPAATQQLMSELQDKLRSEQGQGAGDPVTRTRVLTERIPAVLMARVEGASDDEVCKRLGKQPATPQGRPLLRLARLGRSVPENRSSLWLLWVNLWLYPTIYPGGRDPYSIDVIVTECGIYAADPFFWRLMKTPLAFEHRLLTRPEFLEFLARAGRALEGQPQDSQEIEEARRCLESAFREELIHGVEAKAVARLRSSFKTDVAWCVPGFYQKVTCGEVTEKILHKQQLDDQSDGGSLVPYLNGLAAIVTSSDVSLQRDQT